MFSMGGRRGHKDECTQRTYAVRYLQFERGAGSNALDLWRVGEGGREIGSGKGG